MYVNVLRLHDALVIVKASSGPRYVVGCRRGVNYLFLSIIVLYSIYKYKYITFLSYYFSFSSQCMHASVNNVSYVYTQTYFYYISRNPLKFF